MQEPTTVSSLRDTRSITTSGLSRGSELVSTAYPLRKTELAHHTCYEASPRMSL